LCVIGHITAEANLKAYQEETAKYLADRAERKANARAAAQSSEVKPPRGEKLVCERAAKRVKMTDEEKKAKRRERYAAKRDELATNPPPQKKIRAETGLVELMESTTKGMQELIQVTTESVKEMLKEVRIAKTTGAAAAAQETGAAKTRPWIVRPPGLSARPPKTKTVQLNHC
jgi:hypothetical protein